MLVSSSPPLTLTQEAAPPSKVLGMFGMSRHTREADMRDIFGKFGELEDVLLIRDRRSGESKRFGFAYFKTIEDAARAREDLNGTVRSIDQVILSIYIEIGINSPVTQRQS